MIIKWHIIDDQVSVKKEKKLGLKKGGLKLKYFRYDTQDFTELIFIDLVDFDRFYQGLQNQIQINITRNRIDGLARITDIKQNQKK